MTPREADKIRRVIEDEESLVRVLQSDVFRSLMAGALRRAGVRDEAALVANAVLTRAEAAPLPSLMAAGVIAYLVRAIEGGTAVRRAALERDRPRRL